MPIQVVRVQSFCSVGALRPELQLVLVDDPPQPLRHNLREDLIKNGIWHSLDGPTWTNHRLVYAVDGDFHATMAIQDDPQGFRVVKGEDGQLWRYQNARGWGYIETLPHLGNMVYLPCFFQGSGNIQSGHFAQTLVEAKILEAGLPYVIQQGRANWVGPMDTIRDVQVYAADNKLTWGVLFFKRAYEGALKDSDFGGAYWPDYATAKAVADLYIQKGTRDVCANLHTLQARFPDHPVVAQVVALEGSKQGSRP